MKIVSFVVVAVVLAGCAVDGSTPTEEQEEPAAAEQSQQPADEAKVAQQTPTVVNEAKPLVMKTRHD